MRRILVVDDGSPDDTWEVAQSLVERHRYGLGVAMADGSASGLAALGETSFDLMIVDTIDACRKPSRSAGRPRRSRPSLQRRAWIGAVQHGRI